jgi:hypothetical protein
MLHFAISAISAISAIGANGSMAGPANNDFVARLRLHRLVSRRKSRCQSNTPLASPIADCIEVFYNQRRRHSTLGQISSAAFERRAIQAA